MDGQNSKQSPPFAWASERERLLWAVRVRWAVILGFYSLVLLLQPVGLFAEHFALVAAALLGVVSNGLNHICVKRLRGVVTVTIIALAMDNLLITYASAYSGGIHSPLVIMFSVQVVTAAMLVTTRVALVSASIAAGCAMALIALESHGFIEPALLFQRSAAARPEELAHLAAVAWGACLIYGLSLLVFVGGFVSERLRRSEGELAVQNRTLADAYQRLKQAEAQLIQTEKMRALGQVVAGVAHELNNPISFVFSNIAALRHCVGSLLEFYYRYAPQLASTPRDEQLALASIARDAPQLLDDCEEGARRAKYIVGELRSFARAGRDDSFQDCDLNVSLERTRRLLRHRFNGELSLVLDLDELPHVQAIPGQLDQVFLNLVVNALEAIGERGRIVIRSRFDRTGDAVRISVIDNGPGIAPEHVAHIFEPFFTTKLVGQGTGLGLSVSFAIAQRHGGSLTVESSAGQGATFELLLPVATKASVLS